MELVRITTLFAPELACGHLPRSNEETSVGPLSRFSLYKSGAKLEMIGATAGSAIIVVMVGILASVLEFDEPMIVAPSGS